MVAAISPGYSGHGGNANSSVQSAKNVTKSDSVALDFPTRTIWVGTAGDVTVRHAADATEATYKNVPVGWFDVAATHILATGTTASDFVACQ